MKGPHFEDKMLEVIVFARFFEIAWVLARASALKKLKKVHGGRSEHAGGGGGGR